MRGREFITLLGGAARGLVRGVTAFGRSGGTIPLRPGRSEVDLFRDGKSVIDLTAGF